MTWLESLRKNFYIYILILPGFLLTLVFGYLPMPGLIAAFQDYDMFKGFFRSPWAQEYGFHHILEVFRIGGPFLKAVINTLYLNIINIALGFPMPILLALLLNELKVPWFKKIVQSISYLPHFLSSIVVIGLAMNILTTYGPVNELRLILLGDTAERINYLSLQEYFVPIQVLINIWQGVGWGSILYLASIAGVDQNLYEAAAIDGANRFRQAIHITLPTIIPTATMILIFTIGSLLGSNFDYVYGLQNAFIDFDVISTIMYKRGIGQGEYSASTAIGLMQGAIGFLLTYIANRISKALSGISIF